MKALSIAKHCDGFVKLYELCKDFYAVSAWIPETMKEPVIMDFNHLENAETAYYRLINELYGFDKEETP